MYSIIERGALMAYWVIGDGVITARTAKQQFEKMGCDISLRTVQRDLHNLSCVLPLVVDGEGKQGVRYYWSVQVK